jgi:hypothetical protein
MSTGHERGESLECHGSTFFAPLLREPQVHFMHPHVEVLSGGSHNRRYDGLLAESMV